MSYVVSWLYGKMTLESIFGKCSSHNVYAVLNEFSSMIMGTTVLETSTCCDSGSAGGRCGLAIWNVLKSILAMCISVRTRVKRSRAKGWPTVELPATGQWESWRVLEAGYGSQSPQAWILTTVHRHFQLDNGLPPKLSAQSFHHSKRQPLHK